MRACYGWRMHAAHQIAKALKKTTLPDWVESTRVEPMVDHTGDPALRVIVVVRPEREEIVKDGRALTMLVEKIHATVENAGVTLFPYTRFTVSGEAA